MGSGKKSDDAIEELERAIMQEIDSFTREILTPAEDNSPELLEVAEEDFSQMARALGMKEEDLLDIWETPDP